MVLKLKEISIFLANNYIWFVLVDVFVLFALIGYLMEKKRKKNKIGETEVLETIKFDDNTDNVVEELNIQLGDKASKTLSSVVNSINSEENKKEDTKVDETETLI